ncbi:hypothetical protein [Corynebacterium aquilae]|uniref:Membrane protein n=1 Tax=Corynebacterium aquilae DSM 44791 TaxID=1431546 RepID=A0A1L7CIT6_9CORY|nr:hypothetical protein [Corynebacterium aquilae]APT85693.1 membrane protein [Corynebacterium aquilae DSM 44791]
MYAFIWNHLPGPVIVKAILALAILAAIFYLLMAYVFPYVSTLMPYNDVAV